MTANKALIAVYAPQLRPLKDLAQKAYGSRDTVSPQHDASREYTRLICEFYNAGGSLLDLAQELGVTYAGLRRRVTTADQPASSNRKRTKFDMKVYDEAVKDILKAKGEGTEAYHNTLKKYYDAGLSLARIATNMGLSSANPLYYGVGRATRAQSLQAEKDAAAPASS